METVWNKTEGKAKSKMGRRCEEWFEEDGSDQLETKDAGEETMERNKWASQNSQRVVEAKEEEEYEVRSDSLYKHVYSCMWDGIALTLDFLGYWLDDRGICYSFTGRIKGLGKRLLKAADESDT